VKKEGAGTVPARKLLDYVRLLPEGDVNMKFLENHWASITSGRSRTRIAGMSRESFPELPQMPETMAEIPTKTLASMIVRTSFAISMEESRFTLSGALLLMRPEGLAMVATDGHRLSYAQAAQEDSGSVGQQFRALIPRKAMMELVKLADEAGPEGKAGFAGDDNAANSALKQLRRQSLASLKTIACSLPTGPSSQSSTPATPPP
jgi:DNA polymerase-3 subunit beta